MENCHHGLFNGTDDFIIGVVAGTVCDYLAYYINDIFRKNAYDLNAVRILTADINSLSLLGYGSIDITEKKLIMLADAAIAASTLLLAVAFLMGYRYNWALFIVLAIRSAGTGIQTPTVNAIIPQIVPQEKLMKINGINSTLSSLIMFSFPGNQRAIFDCRIIGGDAVY